MIDREQILEFMNELIINNQGQVSTEDTIVRESGIDSFGFALVFLELDDEYGCFDNEYTNQITDKQAATMTIKDIIDKVVSCS